MAKQSLAIAWNGLPTYAATLIAEGRNAVGYDFPVIGTKPNVPCTGIEELLPHGLTWIDKGKRTSWEHLGIETPKLLLHSGWRYPHFISLANQVRENGGKVVGFFDNNWKNSLRQKAGSIYFRHFLRKKYFKAWVPGKSGKKLARQLGFPERDIVTGLYSANPKIFAKTTPILERRKQIVFIGQFIQRKNVLNLAQAFAKFSEDHPDWTLRMIGCGPLENQLRNSNGISISPFLPPNSIAKELNSSRFLVLPSFEEHWGLVVHEACLCGCGLILSNKIGAANDFSQKTNTIQIRNLSSDGILASLDSIASLGESDYCAMESTSLDLAKKFDPKNWADSLVKIIEESKC